MGNIPKLSAFVIQYSEVKSDIRNVDDFHITLSAVSSCIFSRPDSVGSCSEVELGPLNFRRHK